MKEAAELKHAPEKTTGTDSENKPESYLDTLEQTAKVPERDEEIISKWLKGLEDGTVNLDAGKENLIVREGGKYIYETDENGRIISVKIDNLELKNRTGQLEHDPNTPDKKATDDAEIKDAKGGRYGDLMQQEGREGKEVHHMPADSVSPLERKDGPAIIMEKSDHNQTASYGSSKDAKEYRDEQKKLIEEGKFREAFEMDVEDIREKFGDKYDEAIAEAEAYLDKLESEGKI